MKLRKVQSQTGKMHIYSVPEDTEHWADWHDADAIVRHGTRIAIGDGRYGYQMAPAHPDYDAADAALQLELARMPEYASYAEQLAEERRLSGQYLGLRASVFADLDAVGISTRL